MQKQVLFKKILRDNHFSHTLVRSAIFNALLDAEPQTMRQLIASVEGKGDRVSIYRTIELYEKLGIVQRVNIGWKYKIELSDIFLDHHHHMTCLTCGRVIAIKDEHAFEDMIARLGRANGFVLKSHQLEMQGYCAQCSQSV